MQIQWRLISKMKNLSLMLHMLILILLNLRAQAADSSTFASADVTSNRDFNDSHDFGTEQPTIHRREVPCSYARGLVVGDRKRELECCDKTVKIYHTYWLTLSRPLSRYLETLKSWNCPQFESECDRRLFSFNQFTDLMYDYVCENQTFFEKCVPKLNALVETSPNLNSNKNDQLQNVIGKDATPNSTLNDIQWKDILSQIHPAQMTIEELMEPCVQVAQFAKTERNETFQEVVDFGIPSCGISWCGFGAEAIRAHEISIGTCLDPRCKTGVIVILIVFGFLGFTTTILNFLIIIALCVKSQRKSSLLKNSQAVYKLSLAIADLLVGVMVLPMCIANLYKQVWTRHLPRDELRSVAGYEVINGTISENVSVIQVDHLAGNFETKFSLSYVNFAGFFTAVSIFVSVYMLAGAGFDRLNAVAKPFTYKKRSALAEATRACIVFWVFAFIFGILPVFVSQLKYVLILSTLFTTFEIYGYILYAVSFVVPLVIVWIVNFLTYYHSKKHANFRRSLTETAQKKRQRVERRLASTLRLMVGIFTFNTLPLLITLICPLFIPGLLPTVAEEFDADKTKVYLTVQFVTVLLLFGNSLCNFFVYSARNDEFRRTLKELFKKIGKATKLSTCLNSTDLCCRDIARRSSSVSLYLSRTRRNTATTMTKADESHTHVGDTEHSDVFTISMSSRANTPTLNGQRRYRHDGVGSTEGGKPKARLSRGFSMTLESLNEDTIFGTPPQSKKYDQINVVEEPSSENVNEERSECDNL